MGLGMWQIEGSAEHVTELVVQRHADGSEAGAAQPGAIERIGPRSAILRILDVRIRAYLGPFIGSKERLESGSGIRRRSQG